MPDEQKPGENVVQWVYASTNNQELEERYDEWARSYDEDLERDFQWIAPQRAVEHLIRYVPRSGAVLDAGAGTGLVGELLAKEGYTDLVGIDLSPGMLDVARAKGVYRDLLRMVLGEHLDFPSQSFDAVISVGVFTLGHAPASAFDELARVTRPGGHVLFTLRPDIYEGNGFKEKQSALEGAGAWKLLEVSQEFQPLPRGEPEVFHQVWVYQVPPA
jgi:SAM-dependent methyltransferase